MAFRPADPRKPRHGGVTMADIGRLAGVTQVTVSRALSTPEKVSAETLERVRNAVRQTGYVPNALAGALASSKSNLVSALVPSITNVVYSSMLHAFSEIMRGHGYQIMVSETGADAEREEQAIAAHLSRRPDAVLLTGVKHGPAVRRMLVNAAIPVVEIWDLTDTPIDCCVGFPIWQDAIGYLDGRVAYRLNENIEVSVEGSNLLQSETKLYQQVDGPTTAGGTNERLLLPYSWFKNDRRIQASIRLKY